MPDANPPDNEHLADLFSQLKDIIGKLSHSEELESKGKAAPPSTPPAPAKVPPSTAPTQAPAWHPADTSLSSGGAMPPARVDPFPVPDIPFPPSPAKSSPSMEEDLSEVKIVPISSSPSSPKAEEAVQMSPEMPLPTVSEQTVEAPNPPPMDAPPGVAQIPTAVCYPQGQEAGAKNLAQKLETITPKFTKVTFRLSVQTSLPYEPRSDWKTTVLPQILKAQIKALFIVVDRAIDEAKRKSLAAEFESQGIYFQDVPAQAVDKKAFYTDVLLGMVFFFDSHKPTPPAG